MFSFFRSLFPPPKTSRPSLPATVNSVPSSLFTFSPSNNSWVPTRNCHPQPIALLDEGLHIISWNVDFGELHPGLRIESILNHLHSLLYSRSSCANQSKPGCQSQLPPAVLLFQEVHNRVLKAILDNYWVREEFIITTTGPVSYADKYSTVTLISRCLAPALGNAFRVLFQNSVMGRDALFIDLKIKKYVASTAMDSAMVRWDGDGSIVVVRIANTHLESLPEYGAQMRPAQLKELHKVLFTQEVYVGIVGGRLGVIGSEDEVLVEKVGFTDLWMSGRWAEEGEGKEKSRQIWGHQPRCGFESARFDQILACGNLEMMDGAPLEMVGVGCSNELNWEKIWASGHYGLMWVVR